MRKFKSMMCGFFAMIMVLGVMSVPALATDESITPPNSSMTEGYVPDLYQTRATTYEYQNESIYNSGSASNSFKFSLSSSYPYGKVWVSNTSSSSCTVSLTYKSKTATPFATYTLPAGSSNTYWIWSNGNYDNYYCNLATTDGSSLSGTISIRKGTTLEEMGYTK